MRSKPSRARACLPRAAASPPGDGIRFLPSGPRYDIVVGDIVILDSQTRDTGGRRAMVAAGHIGFRQSLLLRAADARGWPGSGPDRLGPCRCAGLDLGRSASLGADRHR